MRVDGSVRLNDACVEFGLGAAQTWVPVGGGLSNRLFRVTTERGQFAVKQLMLNADHPEFLRYLHEAYAIERAAFLARVPMPEPIPHPGDGRPVTHVGDALVRVHRWLDGAAVHPRTIDPALVRTAGRLLARIHQAGRVGPPLIVGPRPDYTWQRLAGWAAATGAPFADELYEVVPLAESLDARISVDLDRPSRPTLTSHSDFDPKNCLLLPHGGLAVTDWDTARPVDPSRELGAVVLDWCGAIHGDADAALTTALRTGYREAGGPASTPAPDAVASWLRTYLDWFAVNIERLRRDQMADVAINQVRWGMDLVRRATRYYDHWVALVTR